MKPTESVATELYTTEATESRKKAEADAERVDKDPEEIKRQFEALLKGAANDKKE